MIQAIQKKVSRTDLIAMFLSAVVISVLYLWMMWSSDQSKLADIARREAMLPERWFVVSNVAVPDFIQGSDPIITYSRDVRLPFIGHWLADIHKAGSESTFPVCSGSGTSRYEPTDAMPDTGVTLSWFMDKKCDLPPGKYILDTTWQIDPEGYPQKTTRFTSNPFTVLPQGSQLFITPSQVLEMNQ